MRQSSSFTRMVSRAFAGSWSTKQNRHLLQHSRVPDIIGVEKFSPRGAYSPLRMAKSNGAPSRSTCTVRRRLAVSAW